MGDECAEACIKGHVAYGQRWCMLRSMIETSLFMSPLAKRLGWAGLLPQLVAVLMIASGNPAFYFAGLALAACYAALILSFLGGIWWGLSLSRQRVPRWALVAGIVPSLIALASFIPGMFGWPWPRPSLILIAISLVASPLVDRALLGGETGAREWLALRIRLSLGLGLLSFVAALL